ncbi:hypothetical protein C8F01DRAFT_1363266 [Mycena amicta]|nr:hypothetical protein C8F01DRAFT_1363266 [Mycena amicta]
MDLDDTDLDDCDSDASSDDGDAFVGRKFPEATNKSWSTEKLFGLLEKGKINLDARYQRRVVWNEKAQSALIDSLLRNAPVSQVVFSKYTENGKEKWRCVDGKQRLTSIRKFIEGEIPCTLAIVYSSSLLITDACLIVENAFTGKKYWYTERKNETGKRSARVVLPESIRDEFLSKEISCVIYNDLLPTQENDIFKRLQLGAPLTTAEKLQVHDTPRANLALKYLEAFLDNPASPLHKDSGKFALRRNRAMPFRYLVTILHTLSTEKMVHLTEAMSDKWLANEERVKSALKDSLQGTLEVYEAIAAGSDAFQKQVAPVEFHATVVFVHRYRATATLAALVECIIRMKDDIRAKYPREVKSTPRVYQDLEAFMARWARGPGNVLKAGEVCATEQVRLGKSGPRRAHGNVPSSKDASAPTLAGAKRKRQSETLDGGSEAPGAPKRSVRTKAATDASQSPAATNTTITARAEAPAFFPTLPLTVKEELEVKALFTPNGLLGGGPCKTPKVICVARQAKPLPRPTMGVAHRNGLDNKGSSSRIRSNDLEWKAPRSP